MSRNDAWILYIAKNCAKDFFMHLTTFAPQYEGVLYKIILLEKVLFSLLKKCIVVSLSRTYSHICYCWDSFDVLRVKLVWLRENMIIMFYNGYIIRQAGLKHTILALHPLMVRCEMQ